MYFVFSRWSVSPSGVFIEVQLSQTLSELVISFPRLFCLVAAEHTCGGACTSAMCSRVPLRARQVERGGESHIPDRNQFQAQIYQLL